MSYKAKNPGRYLGVDLNKDGQISDDFYNRLSKNSQKYFTKIKTKSNDSTKEEKTSGSES